MDCCNYMQYRHPYYGPPFYENGLYTREYYAHPYQNYYGSHYYAGQQWPCAASFPDYVYNPKEARIRKAMREASRGIPSPRGTRRLQTWGNPEEQLMMAPSSELGTPLCNTSAFPGPSPGQFMQPMNNYNKLVPVLPSAGWLQDSPTYMQHNPIVELQQHQTNMWQHYPETLRPCTGSGYMVESQLGVYQEVGSEEVMAQKKYKSEGDTFSSNESVIESVLPKSGNDKTVKSEKVEEGKETTEDSRVLLDSNSVEQGNSFVPAFQETVIVQNPFDKDDDVKLKKGSPSLFKKTALNPSSNQVTTKTSSNNQDSGFLLTPPQCPLLKPIPGDSNQDENCRDCFCHRSKFMFPSPLFYSPCNLENLFMDCNPNLIYTDVGIIPMYDNNSDVERLLNGFYVSKWRAKETNKRDDGAGRS